MRKDNEYSEIKEIIEGTSASPLLRLTLYQLRAYVALCHERTQAQAWRLLGSNSTAVRRPRETVETILDELCKEKAFTKQAHQGRELGITPAGEIFLKHAEQILRQSFILSQELQKPRPVRLALTSYMTEVPFVRQILERAQTTLRTPIIIRHISSDEKTTLLKDSLVDFVFAGTAAKDGEPDVDRGVSFQPFLKVRMGLLSNYRMAPEVPGASRLIRRERESFCRRHTAFS